MLLHTRVLTGHAATGSSYIVKDWDRFEERKQQDQMLIKEQC